MLFDEDTGAWERLMRSEREELAAHLSDEGENHMLYRVGDRVVNLAQVHSIFVSPGARCIRFTFGPDAFLNIYEDNPDYEELKAWLEELPQLNRHEIYNK